MNLTAKKLREATDCVSGNAITLVQAISQVREKLDVEETDTFDGDLVAVLEAIAYDLDELQARAAGANNLRQKLESAEKKAERRKQHIGYLETALHDKNALLEQRGGTIARLTAENGKLRKQVPSERERAILDMWPRFEDGEYVWFGDVFIDGCGYANEVRDVRFDDRYVRLVGVDGFQDAFIIGERVKRPAPKVLDADGVEIKVGDTVWFRSLSTGDRMRKATVTGFGEHSLDGPLATLKDEAGKTLHIDPKKITHVQPDSWKRLEEDAVDLDDMPCDFNAKDLIRRAKALAGVEVD